MLRLKGPGKSFCEMKLFDELLDWGKCSGLKRRFILYGFLDGKKYSRYWGT